VPGDGFIPDPRRAAELIEERSAPSFLYAEQSEMRDLPAVENSSLRAPLLGPWPRDFLPENAAERVAKPVAVQNGG
jgi:hypothetical protein